MVMWIDGNIFRSVQDLFSKTIAFNLVSTYNLCFKILIDCVFGKKVNAKTIMKYEKSGTIFFV